MTQNDGQEKNHGPSAKKLTDARAKGEIVRSNEANAAIAFVTVVFALITGGPYVLETAATRWMMILAQLGADKSVSAGFVITSVTPILIGALLPVIAILLFVTVQKSWVLTPKNIAPDWKRLSMLSNAKQKFGPHGLIDFCKNIGKILLVLTIAAAVSRFWMDDLIQLPRMSLGSGLVQMTYHSWEILAWFAAVFALFAALDYYVQWRKFMGKMRMTQQEVKDEMKEAEGDPHLKQTRRQRAIQFAQSDIATQVKNADVIIVNPTHFAVALKWDRSSQSAPICTAKGTDHLALHMRQLARDANVAIHSDPPTARALYATVDLGDPINPEHYAAVAAAIRFADSLRTQ